MFSEFLQYLFTGITIGATYALIALGFTLIYNASHVINFAQGEFLMIGGMATVSLTAMGVPMLLAIVLAVVLAGVLGVRSEEHTSELQSRPHLVCRLLLEKKKKNKCS